MLLGAGASGATFEYPPAEFDLIGAVQVVEARYEDTLLDIARRYDIGQDEILGANPTVDRWLPGEGTRVLIPSRYILPPPPHKGLILNLPEMRLYYFPKPKDGQPREVQTYPVSIGRILDNGVNHQSPRARLPLFPGWVVIDARDARPVLATIFGAEKRAGIGAGPE